MAKQKWLVALLVGSSIGCFCGDSPTDAQSLSSLKFRLQVLPNSGDPNAGGLSNPLSINNRDWVSGIVNPPNDLTGRPGLWRRTEDSQSGQQSWQLTDLGTLGGPNANVHSPIKNEIGWLAGASDIAATDPKAENFCSSDCTTPTCAPFTHVCQGFLWRAETNKMIALPPITPSSRCNSQFKGGCNSIANSANNTRQIAGAAETGVIEQGCAAPQVFLYQGVVWGLNASGTPVIERTLPPIVGDTVSQALGMNDAGIVVGASGACGPSTMATSQAHAVMWKNGQAHVLGTLGGTLSNLAQAVNDVGWVVGSSNLAGDTVTHAFLWQEGVGMKDLGSLLPDDTFVFPQSINNRGEVVGLSCGPSEPNPFGCDGFYWRNGVMIDVNAHLTQKTSLQICCANDINDSGEIPVAAFDPNYNGGDFRAAVLVPSQDQQNTAQNLPVQSVAAVQRSVLPSNILQRLNPRLLGWKIAPH
jgi:probable HAF family extracellular repeat protein